MMEYKWKSKKSERSLVENGSLLKSKEVQRKLRKYRQNMGSTEKTQEI